MSSEIEMGVWIIRADRIERTLCNGDGFFVKHGGFDGMVIDPFHANREIGTIDDVIRGSRGTEQGFRFGNGRGDGEHELRSTIDRSKGDSLLA